MLSPFLCVAQPDLTDEEITEIYCEATGEDRKQMEEFLCIDRWNGYENIIVIGRFAHNAGCSAEGLIVDGEYGPWEEMFPIALSARGWRSGDLIWTASDELYEVLFEMLSECSMAWGEPLYDANTDFDHPNAPEFKGPFITIEGEEIKGAMITFWVAHSPGMLPQNSYTQYELIIDGEGNEQSMEAVNSFTVQIGWDDE